MAWNTKKLHEMIDLPRNRRPDIMDSAIAEIGPVATSDVNHRGMLHFPLAEYREPIRLRAA